MLNLTFFCQNFFKTGHVFQNLVTNIIFTLVLLVIFVVLRKNAWRLVNRIARKSDVDRWTHLFFSFTSDVAVTIEQEAKG